MRSGNSVAKRPTAADDGDAETRETGRLDREREKREKGEENGD